MTIVLRPPRSDDLGAMLALNNAFASETSLLGTDSLRQVLATACHARIAGDMDAFCIALNQDAAYDSPNFIWFRQRYSRFVYIDRVIVAAGMRGRGIARALYRDLASAARHAGHGMLCCEVNVSPPNPPSDRFHAAFGFVETGRATMADRGKTVRYLTLDLTRRAD